MENLEAHLTDFNKTMYVLREKTNKMQQLDVYFYLPSQHISGIIMPIFRRTKTLLVHLVYCSGSAECVW
jgi:esterase/lipase superfamily enzyme